MARHSALKNPAQKKREAGSDLQGIGNARAHHQRHLAPGLDRLIHERMRLGIVSALAANESPTFEDLKTLMDTTDGISACTLANSKTVDTSSVSSRLKGACRRPNTN